MPYVDSNQDASNQTDLYDVALAVAAVGGAVMLGRHFAKGSKQAEKAAVKQGKKELDKAVAKDVSSQGVKTAVKKGDVQGEKDLETVNKMRQANARKQAQEEKAMVKQKLKGVDEVDLSGIDPTDPYRPRMVKGDDVNARPDVSNVKGIPNSTDERFWEVNTNQDIDPNDRARPRMVKGDDVNVRPDVSNVRGIPADTNERFWEVHTNQNSGSPPKYTPPTSTSPGFHPLRGEMSPEELEALGVNPSTTKL